MFRDFIQRPVLAIVISVLIVFMGMLAIKQLPTSQFPEIAPTTVNIFIAYPGASADVLTRSTLVQLETAINGVQGMRYIASDATSAGEATIRVIFEPGTDPNEAVVNVKTRVDQVMPNLPPLVQREGVIITPVQPSMLMYVNLYGDGKDADELFLYNYAFTQLIPEIQRIPGVAQAQILGSRKYAMRVWLKPDRMRAYKVSAEEVMEAMAGAEPHRPARAAGPELRHRRASVGIRAGLPGPVQQPEQYKNIIIRANEEGRDAHACATSPTSSWAASSSTSTRTSTAIHRPPSC